ncbi:UBP26 [Scenedesmus sp. PABB004]|nr:UBP26 [Scenedesmus sp. PABB004]
MAPKGKAKARGEELEAAEARALLEKLDAGEELPLRALAKVFRLGAPCAPSCGTKGSKGAKDNPECFCALVPAEGSFRKKGLWQKEPVLGALGADPANERRASPDTPAGLRNLGNTCYVNAALQFLAAIPNFRRALYVLEDGIAGQDIIRQLRELFVELRFGPRRYVDPEPFANSLQLNHAVQQDGQEFLKLLLTKLEAVFAASQQQDVASVVQRLFRGHFSYVTTCRSCGRASEGSRRQVEYYELPLQVQGMPSLQHSLVAALSPDELVGDNQYFCESCGTKCDAERQMALRSLPRYLCLSLQRFVFDLATCDKKKAMDKLTIPTTLDVAGLLASAGGAAAEHAPLRPGSPGAEYELAAVLIHKGSSASHGHYVAHIRMPESGTWWRFDDESAEEMGPAPTSHPGDHGTTAAVQAAAGSGGGAGDDGGKAAGGAKKRGRGGGAAGAAAKRGRGARGGAKAARGRARGKAKAAASSDEEEEAAAGAGGSEYDEDAAMAAALAASRCDAGDSEMAEAVRRSLETAQQPPGAAAAAGESEEPEEGGGRRKRKAAAAAAPDAAAAKKPARGKGGAKAAAAAAAAPAGDAPGSAQPAEDGQAEVVSGNAYFVVYRQRGEGPGAAGASTAAASTAPASTAAAGTAADGAVTAGAEEPAAGALPPRLRAQLEGLPAGVVARVEALHAQYAQACASHQQMRQEALARVKQRQEEVTAVSQLLRCSDEADAGHFLPAAWLDAWANSDASPGPVDNAPLLCPHHRLSPDKPASLLKRVSSAAWDALVAAHAGGPSMSLRDACPLCLRAALAGLVGQDTLAELREQAVASLMSDEGGGVFLRDVGDGIAPAGHYVSKTWLAGFRTRRGTGGANLQAPTASIACCHGLLAPESRSNSAKRVVVSEATWGLLRRVWALSVQREVAARRAKAARTAAAAAAAAGAEAVPDADDDGVTIVEERGGGGDVRIVGSASPSPPAKAGRPPRSEPGSDAGDGDVQLLDDGGAPAASERASVGAGERASTPSGAAGAAAAAAASAWQLALPLDGSVELSEAALLEALPSFHSVHAAECEACAASLQEAAAGHQEARAAVEVQRAALGKLLSSSVQESLEPGAPYYLVPNDWLATWRTHLAAVGSKKAAATAPPPAPPPLPDAVRPLLCSCHPEAPGVAVPLPSIVNKRGRFAQADQQGDALRLVSAHDWQALLLHHSGLDPGPDAAPAPAPAGAASPGAGGRRGSRPRNAAPASAEQAEAAAVLAQRIASLADLEPSFRGIRAVLRVEQPQPNGAAPPAARQASPAAGAARSPSPRKGGAHAALAAAQAALSEDDPAGLAAAAANPADEDWRPDDADGEARPAKAQAGRAHGAGRHRASSGADDGGGSGPAGAVSAASALRGWLVTDPAPCEQHLAADAASRRAALLSYEGAEVMAELVEHDGAAQPGAAGGAERKSRRARKNRQPLRVSCGDTLAALRLRVYEALGVHPRNQRIFLRGAVLGGDEAATLAALEVYPDDELRVVNTREVDNDDVSSLFDGVAGARKGKRREVETGFRDTALTSAPAAAAPKQEEEEEEGPLPKQDEEGAAAAE